MKPIAILCLFTIAINTAVGSMSSVLFCKHDSGDEHLVSKAAHLQEINSEGCHVSGSSAFGHSDEIEDCRGCTDTEVETKSPLDDATQSQERSVIKTLFVTEFTPFENFDLPSVSCRIVKVHPARAPPSVFAATIQFATTVQFRI